MKSSKSSLALRGYYQLTGAEEGRKGDIDALLGSREASDRTLGALLAGCDDDPARAPALLALLANETALYTRIEICKTLARFPSALSHVLDRLGTIGVNHMRELPTKVFGKESYPLPRDLCARTLIRMDGRAVLDACVRRLATASAETKSELLDVIGHVSFFGKGEHAYGEIRRCVWGEIENHILRYKFAIMLRALASPVAQSDNESLQWTETKEIILAELRRSLEISRNR